MSCLGEKWEYTDQFGTTHFKNHNGPDEANLDEKG